MITRVPAIKKAGRRLCFCHALQYEREAALKDFSSGNLRVLIATDVASRGLDVKGIGHVINMDLPKAFEDYVHRIGEPLGTLDGSMHYSYTSHAGLGAEGLHLHMACS